MTESVWTYRNASEHVWTRLNASEHIRTCRNASEHIQKHPTNSENMQIVEKNKKTREEQEAYEGMIAQDQMANDTRQSSSQFISKILDIREYDVAYHVRCMVDHEIRCSFWYDVDLDGSILKKITHLPEKLDKAPLRIFAFDIETTKADLKFPDSKFD